MKVLVAEDDMFTREGLADILESEGYDVIQAENGAIALNKFEDDQPDFVCLDIMMPEKNGYEVCKDIRRLNNSVPIIFLSAKSEEIDKVIGLDLGADDYITKPFGIQEVTARIRAVTRRCLNKKGDNGPFKMLDIEVNPSSLTIKKDGQSKEINIRDLKILQFFKEHENQVQSRNQIFKACWDMNYCDNTRALDQKISQLRKIIETDPANPQIIQTVHGAGYIFKT